MCRHRVAFAGSTRSRKARVRLGRESWRAVECQLHIGGVEASSSTKLFKSWFCHFPAWWSLLMGLTFWIQFLPLQTRDNGMRFLPHGVVLNNKSMIRHEACSASVTQSHSDTKYDQQTGLDVKPHENLIDFLSCSVGRGCYYYYYFVLFFSDQGVGRVKIRMKDFLCWLHCYSKVASLSDWQNKAYYHPQFCLLATELIFKYSGRKPWSSMCFWNSYVLFLLY